MFLFLFFIFKIHYSLEKLLQSVKTCRVLAMPPGRDCLAMKHCDSATPRPLGRGPGDRLLQVPGALSYGVELLLLGIAWE